MRAFVFTLFALATALPACLSADSNHTIVNVTVFYESLCPSSKAFINEKLYPAYLNLSDHMNLTMVPFGKANLTLDPKKFTCQHNDTECFGNLVQTCALYIIKDVNMNMSMEYVNCLMGKTVMETNLTEYKEIMKKNCTSVNVDRVNNCLENMDVWQKEAEFQTLTKGNNITSVPTIYLNGKRNDDSNSNFKEEICKLLKNDSVQYCSGSASVYGSVLLLLGAYILSQFH